MRKKKAPRNSLNAFLRAEHKRFLDRELDCLGDAVRVLWWLSDQPYPMDRDTHDTITRLAEDAVLHWDSVREYVEHWTYPKFCQLTTGSRRGEIPELQELTFPLDERTEAKVAGWRKAFLDLCNTTERSIRAEFLKANPDLKGSYLRLPYLPLGHSGFTSSIPLVDHCWIDQRVIELCEATAMIYESGGFRLPPLDRHGHAWHRFFPKHTRWTAPKESNRDVFLAALERATRSVGSHRWRRKIIAGRRYLRLDEYRSWSSRTIADGYLSDEWRQTGIAISKWNDWIGQNASPSDNPLGPTVNIDGIILCRVGTPFSFADQAFDVSPIDSFAEKALSRRNDAIRILVALSDAQPKGSERFSWLKPRQKRILQALNTYGQLDVIGIRCRVTTSDGSIRTIYRNLKRLVDEGLVQRFGDGLHQIMELGQEAIK